MLVAPARNPSFSNAATRYLACLTDDTTFAVATIEDLLAARVLSTARREAFSDRYLW